MVTDSIGLYNMGRVNLNLFKLALGRLSIDAVLGCTAGLKNGARKPHTILKPDRAAQNRVNGKPA